MSDLAYMPRGVEPNVRAALSDTPIVVVQGARQVGKSTMLQRVAGSLDMPVLTFDDAATRQLAAQDPRGFLDRHPGGLAVDEVQRVPEILLDMKAAVDRDRRPGRFLLSGSADLLRLRGVHDSLAGRAETIVLEGFAQLERSGGGAATFVDRAFGSGRLVEGTPDVTREQYLELICAGSYPEALGRSGARRDAWFASYLERIIDRDAPEVAGLQRLRDLPTLLRLLAARNAVELNATRLAGDAQFPARTIEPYLDLLETLYLVHRIPSWSTNLGKRVVARPKAVLADTGLVAHLVNTSAADLVRGANPSILGRLVEGFVIGEIRRQLGWSDVRARLFHFRDHGGAEIDLVCEAADGRVVAIEVKATARPNPHDARWLVAARDRLGDRFARGVVLHLGAEVQEMGDRIDAAPLGTLWTP